MTFTGQGIVPCMHCQCFLCVLTCTNIICTLHGMIAFHVSVKTTQNYKGKFKTMKIESLFFCFFFLSQNHAISEFKKMQFIQSMDYLFIFVWDI